MFTLARADAGNYPMRMTPMYLDEVIDDVVRAARVVASTRNVTIEPTTVPSAAFTGDEDLIQPPDRQSDRQRGAPCTGRQHGARGPGRNPDRLRDRGQGPGPGHPSRDPAAIFERFYRGDAVAALRRARRGRARIWRWRAGSPTPTAAMSRWHDRRRPGRRSSSRCRRPAEQHSARFISRSCAGRYAGDRSQSEEGVWTTHGKSFRSEV